MEQTNNKKMRTGNGPFDIWQSREQFFLNQGKLSDWPKQKN
jgi:hypothetical protein